MKGYSALWLTVIVYASFVLQKADYAAAQGAPRVFESNYRTPHSKNFRSEDGRGNFNFGYDIEDGLGGGQFRRESGNAAGVRRGSYGFRGADGRVRVVHWVADHLGFRAAIVSNEPGVVSSSPADVSYNGATVAYSHDTQGASLPSSDNIPSQYQPAPYGRQGLPTPAVFAAPAHTDSGPLDYATSSNIAPFYTQKTSYVVRGDAPGYSTRGLQPAGATVLVSSPSSKYSY